MIAAHQLAQPERLGQVVVGAELEADDLVDLVVAGGQDEDGHLRAGRAEPAEDLEAVHARQAHVEHDEVRRLVPVAISRPSSPERATATS